MFVKLTARESHDLNMDFCSSDKARLQTASRNEFHAKIVFIIILDRSKTNPNEGIMSSLHGVIKGLLKGFALDIPVILVLP